MRSTTELDYSDTGCLGIDFDVVTSGYIKFDIGDGYNNLKITLEEKAFVKMFNTYLEYRGEPTLEESEDKILKLEAEIEELNDKLEQYEEQLN